MLKAIHCAKISRGKFSMPMFHHLSPEERAQLWSCLALRNAQGLGPLRIKKLLDVFGSPYQAVKACLASPDSWIETELVSSRLALDFAGEKWRDRAKSEWAALRSNGGSFIFWGSAGYPHLLQELADPPLFLYTQGNESLLQTPAVGVVGARRCSADGLKTAAFFAQGLSQAGVTVISGMAKGIDRAAHVAALQSCGKSIAVLGCGLDVTYPHCNADLKTSLIRSGLLLSEYAYGVQPLSKHFPIRNRLISGLCRGILVVEATARSGSLITARLALEQGREVFAVPGHSASLHSEGCRALIRSGAKAVFDADDILVELAEELTSDAQHVLAARQKEKQEQCKTRGLAHDVVTLEVGRLEEKLAEIDLPLSSSEAGLLVAPKRQCAHGQAVPGSSREVKNSCGERALVQAGEKTDAPEKYSGLNDEERRVLHALETEKHIDTVCRETHLEIALVSSSLTLLELKGLVARRSGMYYRRT